ncbi:MAG TPA: DUF3826 domain-containing protein [Arachidicoccus soli]|nr:DUF3826 domain-containing protein [Arachidicoccus soli]
MLKNKLVGKIIGWSIFFFAIIFNTHINAQSNTKDKEAIEAKASSWVASLNLNDKAKVERVTDLIATHLEAVRDWNNTHPYTTVPAGINPETGNKLSNLDRQIIANSAMPATVHEALMNGLKKDLTADQVEAILDKYTVGKVAFTLKGYQSIVPNLTDKETAVILTNLKAAREQAVDYKSMKQISAIFEIYKTKNEQYLNSNGRNWHQLYKDYVNKIKAEKAAKKVK